LEEKKAALISAFLRKILTLVSPRRKVAKNLFDAPESLAD